MTVSELPELPQEKGTWDEEALKRRGFLVGLFGVLAGAGTLAVLVSSVRFLVGNSLKPATTKWVEIAALNALPADQVTRIDYSVSAPDAWRNVTKRGTVFVYSNDGGASYIVLDGTCTHLGCIVQWNGDAGQYDCPCHQGVFSRTGQVVSGPPPKPLRLLAVKTENGKLYAEI
jgi:Rieske Fe-S protein